DARRGGKASRESDRLGACKAIVIRTTDGNGHFHGKGQVCLSRTGRPSTPSAGWAPKRPLFNRSGPLRALDGNVAVPLRTAGRLRLRASVRVASSIRLNRCAAPNSRRHPPCRAPRLGQGSLGAV